MEIKEFLSIGEFLTSKLVKENPDAVYIITGDGGIVTNQFDEEKLRLFVKMNNEKDLVFDCGKSNAKIISDKIGASETSAWIGRGLVLELYKTKVKGEMKDAINVKEVKQFVKA